MKHVNPLTMRGDHTEPIQRLKQKDKKKRWKQDSVEKREKMLPIWF